MAQEIHAKGLIEAVAPSAEEAREFLSKDNDTLSSLSWDNDASAQLGLKLKPRQVVNSLVNSGYQFFRKRSKLAI